MPRGSGKSLKHGEKVFLRKCLHLKMEGLLEECMSVYG